MTAQLSDSIFWEHEHWILCSPNSHWPFNPEEAFGIELTMMSSACLRGYVCRYSFQDRLLVLRGITMQPRSRPPVIHGIRPVRGGHALHLGWKYEGLDLPIRYTGEMTIARDSIEGSNLRSGFAQAHHFHRVFNLSLRDGTLMRSVAVSEATDDPGGRRHPTRANALPEDDAHNEAGERPPRDTLPSAED